MGTADIMKFKQGDIVYYMSYPDRCVVEKMVGNYVFIRTTRALYSQHPMSNGRRGYAVLPNRLVLAKNEGVATTRDG
jgi:hypothetical protein